MKTAGVTQSIMIDASHANSGKNPEQQIPVCAAIAQQIEQGDKRIIGVMIESHLVGGRQELKPAEQLTYGQSITDGCIDWDQTQQLLNLLGNATRARRSVRANAHPVS